jgi:hypothetical protein
MDNNTNGIEPLIGNDPPAAEVVAAMETETRLQRKLRARMIKKLVQDPKNNKIRVGMAGQYIDRTIRGHQKKYLVNEDGSLTRVHLITLQPLNEDTI